MATPEGQDSSKTDDTQKPTYPFLPRVTEEMVKPAIFEGEMHYCYVFEPFEEHIEKLKSFEIRTDDVLLYTYPRSGTHWIFRVLDMLMMGKAEYRDFHVDQVQFDYQLLEDMDKLPSPRLLHSEFEAKLLPPQIKEKKPKIVHVYRNPKAIAVSLYHLFQHVVSFQAFASLEVAVDVVKRHWTRFVDEIAELMKENPDLPILHVSYEEMIANPFQTVKRIAEFLETGASDDLCAQIQEACSFHKQKTIEDKLNVQGKVSAQLFRKGGNESWKEEITVAQSEMFDDVLRARKERCMFSAKYI